MTRIIKYKLNTFFIKKFSHEIIYVNELTRKSYVLDFSLAQLELFLTQKKSLESIARKAQEIYGIDYDSAKRIIKNLISIEFIVPSSRDDRYGIWFKRNWRNALSFHLLTSNVNFADRGQDDEQQIKEKILSDYVKLNLPPDLYKNYDRKQIMLPNPKKINANLEDVLLKRRTKRVFSDNPIDLNQLSTVLFTSTQSLNVIRKYVEKISKTNKLMLTLSSYVPFELYFIVNNVSGLDKGIYHYNIRNHSLTRLSKGDYANDARKIAIGQGVDNASVVFFITAIHERYMWRYRNSRAYRNLLIEASSFAQRIILTAQSIGIVQFLTPALRDKLVDDLLGIDGISESTIYLVAIGNKK